MARRLPEWLRIKLPTGPENAEMTRRLRSFGLHTVCEEARCPNQGECWGQGTATFMILGDTCTRACKFCGVATGNPKGHLDKDEPARVAAAVADAGLKYVVLTSVDRDDLDDKGAGHYAATITAVREAVPGALVEALIPDYLGSELEAVLSAGPAVLGHNIEVVRRLTPQVRDHRSSYERSLSTLRQSREIAPEVPTKSSLMLGLSETADEVEETLSDLLEAGVAIVTLGQYLRPSAGNLPVERYLQPTEFDMWEERCLEMGFGFASAGPLVRSSYRAAELFVEGRVPG